MLNQIVLVGRIKQVEDRRVVISVPRNSKNENGEYDNDLIPVLIGEQLTGNVKEYCGEGDIIGVKGKIESLDGNIKIRAEKISFLTTKNKSE